MRHIKNQENVTMENKDILNGNSLRNGPDVGMTRIFFNECIKTYTVKSTQHEVRTVNGKFEQTCENYSIQFSSVAQSCPTVCDPMNRSTPGLPVHHQLPEFTQTHVHRVRDAIQPSHPLSSPSPPAPNPSQHQSLFQ